MRAWQRATVTGNNTSLFGATAQSRALVLACCSGAPPPLGMDSDVWKSELSVFVSAKNFNMNIRILF
jgi:hypothetical protein